MNRRQIVRQRWPLLRRVAIGLLTASLALLAPAPAAEAASYTVSKTVDTDDGVCNRDCSLREAIGAAHNRPGRATVRIPAGSYGLTLGPLDLDGRLRLRGAGADATVIDGGGNTRVFVVTGGVVDLEGVTVQHGAADEGSGIENRGTLHLDAVVVRQNVAGEDGGGLRNTGDLTVNNSRIEDNHAETGGGIDNRGTLLLTNSTVSNNQARRGAGIRNQGRLQLRTVTLANNSAGDAAASGMGAGIYNEADAELELRDAIFLENTAARTTAEQSAGGALLNEGRATLLRVSLRSNTADLGGGLRNIGTASVRDSEITGSSAAYGAGIHNSGDLDIRDSTIGGGEVFFVGGGLYNAGALRLTRTIVHDNVSSEDGGGLYNAGPATLADSVVHTNLAVDGTGGGIVNRATLTMTGGAVRDNTARGLDRGGGGIDNHDTLILQGVTLSDNRTNESGGGLYNSGTARVADAQIVRNRADLEQNRSGSGGGVTSSGRLVLERVTVQDNSGFLGGGLATTGELVVSASTLAGNHADQDGGGLYSAASAHVVLTNSTISGNSAAELGGGIGNFGGEVRVTHVTITANRADSNADESGVGGGIFNDVRIAAPGQLALKNTILAGNRDLTGDGPDCWGAVTSYGYNVIQNTFDCTFAGDPTTDIVGLDARLGPLAANGGPTRTHALLEQSPALDAVPVAACVDLAGVAVRTDQRGVARPQGAACDVGAYER